MSKPIIMKSFNLRIPRDLWIFLKKISAENDTSMNSYIMEKIITSKRVYEKREMVQNNRQEV